MTAPDITVQMVETVTGDFLIEPGEPFWRIEIDGYCADFETEAAATNFCAAINRRTHPEASTAIASLQAENEALRAVLAVADTAIAEMFRYYDGGETRGSYDGKPERNQLRKAGYATRAALQPKDQSNG